MKHTIWFNKKPVIICTNTVVGPKESEGPLGNYFDVKLDNDKSEDTYELSESQMQIDAFKGALTKCGKKEEDISAIISGDLVNEIIVSTFCACKYNIPYLGIYGACSTFGESLIIGSTMISGGFMDNVSCIASSHFSTIERQYRYPLELGTQATPTAQWTVTGAGCAILGEHGSGPKITCATIGKVIDLGINDASNMGAAMAPAAVDTVITHLNETHRNLDYYDMIYTGDLGKFGRSLFIDLMAKADYKVSDNYNDCGAIIYDEDQKTIQGGSGAGCSTVVFGGYLFKLLKEKKINKLLLVPTGALLSKVSSLQGESIPCISHAIAIEN